MYLVRIIETGEYESNKVFVHELVVGLRSYVHVGRPDCDVGVTVVPS